MGNGKAFPEWERARRNAQPEDEAQKRLVELLAQPIGSAETKRLAVRKQALLDLAEGMPQSSASRLHQRLADPNDALGQFMTYELSTPLRDDLVRRLAQRDKAGSRGTDPQQRSTRQTPLDPPKRKDPQAPGGSAPFLIGPPAVVPWPGITAPQYHPLGFPPAGIVGRHVLLVPQAAPAAPTRKKAPPEPPPKRPPKPPPKKKKKGDDKDPTLKHKPRRKRPPKLPPARRPGVLDWLSDALQHMGPASVAVAGLLLVLPGKAVAAALAAAGSVLAGGGTMARAAEVAAKEMLKWTLEHKGLDPRRVFDLNDIRKDFPGVDVISAVRPYQVKAYGIESAASKFEIAMRIANEMVKLYSDEPWRRLPKSTAKALHGAYDEVHAAGAWPMHWPIDPTIDEIRNRLRDTAFAVPDDVVTHVRAAFGKRLAADPKLRELFFELQLGSLADLSQFSTAEQAKWGEAVTKFLFEHVVGIGATTDQLRKLASAASHLPTP